MKEKTQDVKSLEDLLKAANDFRKWAIDFGNELSKILADIQASKKEEDTWEMKCPYREGDRFYFVNNDGSVGKGSWSDWVFKTDSFNQGNVFQTQQEAELEIKRRNLLTRFRAFRDECNGNWKPDWENRNEYKYYIGFQYREIGAFTSYALNGLETFGHFKNIEDCEKAIELFGEEIKELFAECE